MGLAFGGIITASRAIDPVPEGAAREKTLPRCSYASIGRNLLVDADTKHFLEANAAFQNLLGYTSDQVLRLTLYDVVVENCKGLIIMSSISERKTQPD